MSDTWCDACQDHFPVDHYDESYHHLVGDEYGLTGAELLRIRNLEAAASVALAHARKVIKDEATLHRSSGGQDTLPDSTIRLALDIIRALDGEVKP